jgi:hypothetical protein
MQQSPGPRSSARDGIEDQWFKVPNRVVDALMACVSGLQFKVFMCIWRMTVGFHRREFSLSLNQLARRAGISRDSGLDALRFWTQTGLIRKAEQANGRGACVYHLAPTQQLLGGLNRLVENSHQWNFPTTTGRKTRPLLVGLFDSLKDNGERHDTGTAHSQNGNSCNAASPYGMLPQEGRSTVPEGATIPQPDPWELLKKELKGTINRQSFETWILPTRLGYVVDRKIVVGVPTLEWEHMREHFAADIQNALKKLGLPYDGFELQPEGGNREVRHTASKKVAVTAKVSHANSR